MRDDDVRMTDAEGQPGGHLQQQQQQQQQQQGEAGPSDVPNEVAAGEGTQQGKKRGRPKGSKNKPKSETEQSGTPAPKKPKTTPGAQKPRPFEKQDQGGGLPHEEGGAAQRPTSPAAEGTDTAVQQQKRRGRPPGTKNKRKEHSLLESFSIVDCTKDVTVSASVVGSGLGGCAKEDYRISSNSGTHMDAPALCVPGGRTIAQFEAEELTRPMCVIDLSAKFEQGMSSKLSVEDVQSWEAKHGRIPAGALVCLRTGWDVRNEQSRPATNGQQLKEGQQDAAPAQQKGVNQHTPGFSVQTVQYIMERQIAGLGIDTASTDVSNSTNFFVQKLVLNADKFQIKNLDLCRVPASGGLAIVAPLKLAGAVQAPVRVTVMVPKAPPASGVAAGGDAAGAEKPVGEAGDAAGAAKPEEEAGDAAGAAKPEGEAGGAAGAVKPEGEAGKAAGAAKPEEEAGEAAGINPAATSAAAAGLASTDHAGLLASSGLSAKALSAVAAGADAAQPESSGRQPARAPAAASSAAGRPAATGASTCAARLGGGEKVPGGASGRATSKGGKGEGGKGGVQAGAAGGGGSGAVTPGGVVGAAGTPPPSAQPKASEHTAANPNPAAGHPPSTPVGGRSGAAAAAAAATPAPAAQSSPAMTATPATAKGPLVAAAAYPTNTTACPTNTTGAAARGTLLDLPLPQLGSLCVAGAPFVGLPPLFQQQQQRLQGAGQVLGGPELLLPLLWSGHPALFQQQQQQQRQGATLTAPAPALVRQEQQPQQQEGEPVPDVQQPGTRPATHQVSVLEQPPPPPPQQQQQLTRAQLLGPEQAAKPP